MKQKYPRTFHVPWSQGASSDDKTHSVLEIERMFAKKHVVITEKLDGENTTIYWNGECHARSLDSGNHPSRDYVRAKAREIANLSIPEGWRLMGENLYAKHSIGYDRLPDYFVLFGIADNNNISRPWTEVEEWANLLNLPHAPVLFQGVWDADIVKQLYPFPSRFCNSVAEGYVVRSADAFPMVEFETNVAKFVRANHVQTDSHWMYQAIQANRLAR